MYFSLKEKEDMGKYQLKSKSKKNVISLVLAFICISKQREHMREQKNPLVLYRVFYKLMRVIRCRG